MAENSQNPENGDATTLPEAGRTADINLPEYETDDDRPTLVPEGNDFVIPKKAPIDNSCEAIAGEEILDDLPREFKEVIEYALFVGDSVLADDFDAAEDFPVPVSTNADPALMGIPFTVSLAHDSLPAIPPPALMDEPPEEFVIARPPSLPAIGLNSQTGSVPPPEPASTSSLPAPADGETIGPPPDYNPQELLDNAPQSRTSEALEQSQEITRTYDRSELFERFLNTPTYRKFKKREARFLKACQENPKKAKELDSPLIMKTFMGWLEKLKK